MLYQLLRGTARLALRLFYADVKVHGREHIPPDQPVMLVANHPNALVDAMLVATTVKRNVSITARATLFESRPLSAILRRVGVIPLRRAQDVPPHEAASGFLTRNVLSRAHVIEALRGCEAVLVFPEGTSHDRPYVAPLKSGAARLALQAHDSKVCNLHILPIGLIYEAKDQINTDVLVRFGAPIDMDAWCLDNPTGGSSALTREIARRLEQVSLAYAPREWAIRAGRFATALAVSQSLDALAHPATQHDSPGVISEAEIQRVAKSLQRASLGLLGRVDRFVEDVNTVAGQLQSRTLDVDGRLGATEPAPKGGTLVRNMAYMLLLIPLDLLGHATAAVLLRAARYVALRSLRGDDSRDQPAMRTILFALASIPLWCAVLVAIFAPQVGVQSSLLGLGVVVAALAVHACCHKRLMTTARQIPAYFQRGAPVPLPQDLLSMARTLTDAARALETELHEIELE